MEFDFRCFFFVRITLSLLEIWNPYSNKYLKKKKKTSLFKERDSNEIFSYLPTPFQINLPIITIHVLRPQLTV